MKTMPSKPRRALLRGSIYDQERSIYARSLYSTKDKEIRDLVVKIEKRYGKAGINSLLKATIALKKELEMRPRPSGNA